MRVSVKRYAVADVCSYPVRLCREPCDRLPRARLPGMWWRMPLALVARARSHPGRTALRIAAKCGHRRHYNLALLSQNAQPLTPSDRNGKEGVCGSSPQEGFAKVPLRTTSHEDPVADRAV